MPYKDIEKRRAMTRNWRKNNLDACRINQAAYYRKNPVIYLLNACRSRAKKNGLEFNLTKEDIIIPEFCPVLGIKLEHGTKGFHESSPSIDRIDSTKGYIRGNVAIMSFRANRLKHDATKEEVRKLLEWMERQHEPALL